MTRCTNRPDCPCQFCTDTRAEMAEGRTAQDKEARLILEYCHEFDRKENLRLTASGFFPRKIQM